jgi:hypothetical protein
MSKSNKKHNRERKLRDSKRDHEVHSQRHLIKKLIRENRFEEVDELKEIPLEKEDD